MQTFVDPGTDFRCMSFAMQSSSRLFFFFCSVLQPGKMERMFKMRNFEFFFTKCRLDTEIFMKHQRKKLQKRTNWFIV